jgi:hypothetical protein
MIRLSSKKSSMHLQAVKVLKILQDMSSSLQCTLTLLYVYPRTKLKLIKKFLSDEDRYCVWRVRLCHGR